MERNIEDILDELMLRYPELTESKDDIAEAYRLIRHSYDNGGKLLIAGNGGSAADSEHIVGELMKGFTKKRPVDSVLRNRLEKADPELGKKLADKLQGALPAIALTGHNALTTAYANDVDGSLAFAQQLYGYAKPEDVFLGITTSGNSGNVVAAALTAKALGLKVIALTGGSGGRIKAIADCAVTAPANETFRIQELHLPIYHALCRMLEETYFTL